MDTKKARIARAKKLTAVQRDVIIGSLLGDGHLNRTSRGHAFEVHQGIKQKEYLFWKHRMLGSLVLAVPYRDQWKSYLFRTVSHPALDEFHRMFYSGRTKILPKNIAKYLTPLVLAVWLMDDGSRDKGQLRFNTQSFSRQENLRLMRILEAKLGIMATLNRDKKWFRLRICEASMPLLRQLVSPFIIPSMRYKLSP